MSAWWNQNGVWPNCCNIPGKVTVLVPHYQSPEHSGGGLCDILSILCWSKYVKVVNTWLLGGQLRVWVCTLLLVTVNLIYC